MEGCAADLSRDGQGGALLREVAKLEKFEADTTEIKGEELLGCPTVGCSHGSCPDHVHSRRSGNVGKKDSQCEPCKRTSSLACSHAMVQSQISGGTSGVDGGAHIAKNVNELQVAVMHWELTLVEHEFKKFSKVVADSVKTAAMRTMLPKNILERFLDLPFNYEELRNRVVACVGEKLAGQEASG